KPELALPEQKPTSAPPKSGRTSKTVLFGAVIAAAVFAAGAVFGYYQYRGNNNANQTGKSATGQHDKESGADELDVDEASLAEDPDEVAATDETPARSSARGGGSNASTGATTPQPQPRN